MNHTLYITASRHFLTDQLPQNWEDLEEEELNNFIYEHKCEFMWDYDIDYIWECIEGLALDIERILKTNS